MEASRIGRMARALRIQFENAFYHVTCRGNARQEIFRDDEDRENILKLLGRSSKTYQVEVLAYVIMANHFHLLVKTPRGNLQEFMRHFNISYTSHFNRRHNRTGHLYQGRYKSFLIDADEYLHEVSRYIHLNPVRTRAARDLPPDERIKFLLDYRWSSYPGYLKRGKREAFLRPGEVLGYFGRKEGTSRRSYERFVKEGIMENKTSPLLKGKGHGIIGDLDFIQGIKNRFLAKSVRHREVPAMRNIAGKIEPERLIQAVSDVTGVKRNDLLRIRRGGLERGLLMEMLYRHGGMNQREIGEMLGLDYSSVSVARKRYHALANNNKSKLEERIECRLMQE